MQAAPAVQVNVQRFGVWNGLLISLSAVAIGTCGAWFATRSDDLPPWSGVGVAAALLIALFGVSLSIRRHPLTLRWDAQCWYLSDPSRQPADIGPAHVQVMLDVAGWLLLKFAPDAGSLPPSRRWVPVQRRGLEAQWHALRCAVYSPRSETASLAGLDGRIRIE